jgi:hypothetical protein
VLVSASSTRSARPLPLSFFAAACASPVGASLSASSRWLSDACASCVLQLQLPATDALCSCALAQPRCSIASMRGMTGRAVSAAIHSRLKEALASGEPMSYAQLAKAAGCTVRSVRNYLARSSEIFGFTIEQSRPHRSHSVLVRAVGLPPPTAVQDLSVVMAEALRARLFVDSQPLDAPSHSALAALRVSMRGVPVYGSHHESVLSRWVDVAGRRPRRAVRLRLQADRPAHAELMLWPLGAVLHNLEGLLLAGVPIDAESLDAVQLVALDLVAAESDAMQVLERSDTGDPGLDLSSIELGELLDLPFATRPRPTTPGSSVDVHVRFDPCCAGRLQHRLFHRSQRAVLRTDGSLDVKFGPVEIEAAASWVASFGRSIKVMGDKRLRKTVKKRSFSA